jgi:hypothetical protein
MEALEVDDQAVDLRARALITRTATTRTHSLGCPSLGRGVVEEGGGSTTT